MDSKEWNSKGYLMDRENRKYSLDGVGGRGGEKMQTTVIEQQHNNFLKK